MKITIKELDKRIVEKLDQFELLKDKANKQNEEGLIGYNKENGFFLKQYNDILINRVLTEDELRSIMDSANKFNHSSKVFNFSDERLNEYNTGCLNFKKLACLLKAADIKELRSQIKRVKKYENKTLVFQYDGTLSIFDSSNNNTLEREINLISIIEKSFLITDITTGQITDFVLRGSKLYISTTAFGLIAFDLITETAEHLFSDSFLIFEMIDDDRMFAVLEKEKNAIFLVSVSERKIIESWNTLKKMGNQIPDKIRKYKDTIFVYCHSYYTNENSLLIWKLDPAGISLHEENVNFINPLPSRDAKAINFNIDDTYAVLSYLVCDHLVVHGWELNNLFMEPKKVVIKEKGLDYSKVKHVLFTNNRLFTLFDKMVIEFDETGTVQKVMKLDKDLKRIFSLNDSSYGYTDKELITYNYPLYVEKSELFLKVNDSKCNNIDVYIECDPEIKFIFINKDLLQEFKPDILIKTAKGFYVKLFNKNSDAISLKFGIPKGKQIYDVVVHENQIYTYGGLN